MACLNGSNEGVEHENVGAAVFRELLDIIPEKPPLPRDHHPDDLPQSTQSTQEL